MCDCLELPTLPKGVLEQYGTPLQLYSEDCIRTRTNHLVATMRKHFKGFINYYAVKALPNPTVVALLLQEDGIGLDCSSVSELVLAQRLGVSGDKVMFTSNYTSKVSKRIYTFEAA